MTQTGHHVMDERGARERKVVVIGGGPAGLTAAYELAKSGVPTVVVEKGSKVGGLARTETYKGFRFDLGGHRFFTKVEEIDRMWRELLGADFRRRPRLSRIYYQKKFFFYPLRPLNALRRLGPLEALLITLSYLRWQFVPYEREDTFEQWVTNRFGKRLFDTFFKSYTEKVWGIPCSELGAEWAVQRIKDLSLKTAVINMFLRRNGTIKTLIEEFDYPRLGAGMMWDTAKDRIEERGGTVRLDTDVVELRRTGARIDSVVVSSDGRQEVVPGTHFISSMPITDLVKKLNPPPPPMVLEASDRLHHRDFLVVCLIINSPQLFPDNWIYVHDPEVQVARIQNYKNWSPDMVPDPAKTSVGLEYFCTQGDVLWNTRDHELVALAKKELALLGLARLADVDDGCVFRVADAYPVYDSRYREHLSIVRECVENFENLDTIGRNGLHRYNNQDHAMLTGALAARNVVAGGRGDLWAVNADPEYHEEVRADAAADRDLFVGGLRRAFSGEFFRLDRFAFGISLGVATAVLLAAATLALVLKGTAPVGPHLQLLAWYMPGYTVTARGAVWGLAYGFAFGFVAGWLFALFRNAALFTYIVVVRRRVELQFLWKLFDYI